MITKEEFLREVNLSKEDFSDLIAKFTAFEKTLNPAQKDALWRSKPPVSEALRSLGAHVTADDLNRVLEELGIDHRFDDTGHRAGTSVFAVKGNPGKPRS